MKFRIGVAAALALAGNGTVRAQSVTELKPITIKGDATSTIGALPEEYPGGQVAKGARIGALGDRDFMDIPFNVTAFTSQKIEDQGAQTVGEVVESDPSVRNTHSAGGILDSFYIRGFPIAEGNFGEIAFDGIYGIAPTYRVFTEYAERIEVLKGPTAFLYGIAPNSGVGGTINIVPKRALGTDLTRLTTDYASDMQGGAHLDVSRRFGDERQFGIRFNGSLHGGDTPIDDQTRDFFVGSLALDYQGENLRATLDVLGQRETFDAPQRPFLQTTGLVVPDAPDGSLNVQEPWEWSKVTDRSVLGRVEYDLTDDVTWFGALGGGNSHVRRLFGLPTILNSAGDVSITPQNAIFDVDRLTAETGVRAKFDTDPISHTVTLQASYLKQDLDRAIISGRAQLSNMYDPVSRPRQFVADPSSVPKVSESILSGVALSDTLSMLDDRLQFTVGGRFQQIDSKNFNATGMVTTSSDENAVTPLVGVVVRPWDAVSFYANYAEGLSIGETAPTTAINAGETLAPYKATQYEIGTKIDLGQIAMTVSAFQIEKPFGQLESASGGLLFTAGGEQRNRGLEFNVFGEVTDDVRLLGGLTLIDGELTKTSSAATRGNRPVGVPTVQANIGAEWDTPFLEGLTLTGNVIHTSEQYINTTNSLKIPSWTRVDLGARYKTEIENRPVTFRASVENVFNKDYWSGVASFSTIAQGAPLTVKLSMATDF
ncbi:TonB-dependent siderophore receptor [Rhizobium sp. 3T7]|uniref:TonB-dependent receptor n=1 Tax=Rhizobium sp. 3T7 TaxID=2874922 RepID=UPI001CCD965F|nr:TonB-dependent siderophore receptor [Rhizobium sp. 3T7]MBZ9791054.1 TonB-dependent siderophore receptor [Rhizobium sp. 3T7]